MKLFFALLLLIYSLTAQTIGATPLKPSDITLNADELMHNHNGKTITLNGNVKMLFDGYYFAADYAEVNFEKGVITAIGSVSLQSLKAYIEAEKIIYNYQDQKAQIEKGSIQSGTAFFRGDYIEKIDENTYVAENAQYSTCNNCPETWNITGKRIKATIGGYADISVPVLRILTLPVLALPRLIIPLKSERQTGLLVPSFENSETNKFSYTQPFFWAISPQQDSTSTIKVYQTRGIKFLQEYRYMLNSKSRGQLNVGYFNDREFKNSGQNNEIKKSREDRSFLRYIHYFQTKYGLINRMELNHISDLRYLRDFPEDTVEPGYSSLESNFSLTKNFDNHHLSAAVNFNQNLIKNDPFAKNDQAIHKYPEIKYTILKHKIKNTPFLFNLDFNYTNFFRFGDFFDDVCDTNPCGDGQIINSEVRRRIDNKGNGVFDINKDLIRAGQRFDFQPEITIPFQFAKTLNFEANLALRETFYAFNLDKKTKEELDATTSRSYLEPKLSVNTQFSRVYGDTQNITSNLYKHIITPGIEYSILDMIQEPNHIFFGDFTEQNFEFTNQPIVDDDFWGDNKIQFDYEDRVSEKRLVTFNLTNRIIKKDWVNDEPFYREIFYMKMSQSYDFFRNKDENPKPWTRILATTKMRFDNFQLTSISDYKPYENKLNNLANLKILSQDGKYLELSHQYLLKESDGFRYSTRSEFASLGAGFRSRYIDFSGGIEYSLVKNEVRAWNYNAILKPPGDCIKILFSHRQPIGRNEIKWDLEPKFSFESSF